ncbi:aspartyl/asparaginyl beta-hydroxylase domain-containing protein [Bradyrhizobium sp. 26S5]|uniref:aspartyl/asparaginyl beta-hydroxylase domain-containing protein n=1 Tax=Bradyrhizobium sp. 26S5 TaxID=3139729 RepID=UPI0030CC298F
MRPVANAILQRRWAESRDGRVNFHGERWTGWCINGCEQLVRGGFVLGYRMSMASLPKIDLPEANAIIEKIPGKKHAVRLFRLSPGHVVQTHVDAGEFYVERDWREVRKVHVAIITNDDCVNFEGEPAEGRSIHMRPGEYWYLDGTVPHGASNLGTNHRWHLVIDVDPNPKLDALLVH